MLFTYKSHKTKYNNKYQAVYDAVCKNNYIFVNWIPLIFTTSTKTPNDPSLPSPSEREKMQTDAYDHLPPLEEGEEWMIADSGANRHYHRHNRFLFRREKMNNAIGGMTGDNQAATDEFGIFACRLEDEDKINHTITSVGYSVLEAKVGLFSKVQCCFAGNTVIHSGHPETGRHSIILKGSNTFIPYHFDHHTLLWWVKVEPPRSAHCAHAREMNPHAYMDP